MGNFNLNKEKPEITLNKKLAKKSIKDISDGFFKISLLHYDSSQKHASTFRDWQKDSLLSYALDVLHGSCRDTLKNLFGKGDDKFTRYGDFPKTGYTKFEYPKHVPEDAEWARIHVNGQAILVGHIVNDTFYLVFLDKHHHFYLTKRHRKKKDQRK